jgi:hypothetical protein
MSFIDERNLITPFSSCFLAYRPCSFESLIRVKNEMPDLVAKCESQYRIRFSEDSNIPYLLYLKDREHNIIELPVITPLILGEFTLNGTNLQINYKNSTSTIPTWKVTKDRSHFCNLFANWYHFCNLFRKWYHLSNFPLILFVTQYGRIKYDFHQALSGQLCIGRPPVGIQHISVTYHAVITKSRCFYNKLTSN